MPKQRIGIIGGSGFIGQALLRQLSQAGHEIIVYSRHPERHRDLPLFPGVTLRPLDPRQPQQWGPALQGCEALIYLVGILHDHPHPERTFNALHHVFPHDLSICAQRVGVRRWLQMSALNADAQHSPSRYLQSKGSGEEALHRQHSPQFAVTSFRPSVVFGPGDGFIRLFARLLRLAPGFFPIPCPDAVLAPVYVEDVAHAFVAALDNPVTFGQRYDLCGPEIYTLHELVRYLAQVQGLHPYLWPLSDTLSRWQAQVMDYVPGSPLRYDNYLSLQAKGTCRPEHDYFRQFGLQPESLPTHIRPLLGLPRPNPSARAGI